METNNTPIIGSDQGTATPGIDYEKLMKLMRGNPQLVQELTGEKVEKVYDAINKKYMASLKNSQNTLPGEKQSEANYTADMFIDRISNWVYEQREQAALRRQQEMAARDPSRIGDLQTYSYKTPEGKTQYGVTNEPAAELSAFYASRGNPQINPWVATSPEEMQGQGLSYQQGPQDFLLDAIMKNAAPKTYNVEPSKKKKEVSVISSSGKTPTLPNPMDVKAKAAEQLEQKYRKANNFLESLQNITFRR